MKKRVHTCLTLLAILAAIGAGAWLVTTSRQMASRSAARSRLRQILHELHVYDGLANHIPHPAEQQDDGTIKSWRYDVWRFLDHRAGYDFADEDKSRVHTQFVAIVGPDTAFPHEGRVSLKDLPPHMIIVVEVANSQHDWEVPGADLHVNEMPQRIDTELGKGISGDAEGFLVGFVSGEAWLLSNTIPFETLSAFFTINSARNKTRDSLLPYRLLPKAS